MTGTSVKSLVSWFFSMTDDDLRAAEALRAVLLKDLIFRLGIEIVLAALYALCGEPVFALIWLAFIIPAEFGEVVLNGLESRDRNPGLKYLYGQFLISLYGGGAWAVAGVYLWGTGQVILMASGLLMIVGVTAHVTFKYAEWVKGAIVAAIPPLSGLIALTVWPLPFDVSLAERALIVFAIGGLIYYMLVVAVADIQKQVTLKRALEAASEASRTKSIFLANMSHEIRTPMNGVLGMANMLTRTGLDEHQKEMVSVIQSSGDALIGVIDDILDLSKIEAGHLQLDNQPFWLHDLVRNLVVTSEMSAHDKGLEFHLVQSDDRVCLKGDVLRLRQIIGNLLSNAIKFTEDGVVTLTITKELVRDGRACALRFAVADTGVGLTDDDQSRIFEPFVQVDDSLSRRHGGSGLGLSISHRIASMMNGSMGVRSKKGEGAEFSFSCELPVVDDCDAPEAMVTDDATSTDIRSVGDGRPRILVAEDHAHNRRVLQLMLATLDVDVHFVENGLEAVNAYREGAFDLLLLDIQMPELTGVEALKLIREYDRNRENPPVPALALTANAMKHQVDGYLEAGFDAHVAKPIVIENLVGKMNDVLSRTD